MNSIERRHPYLVETVGPFAPAFRQARVALPIPIADVGTAREHARVGIGGLALPQAMGKEIGVCIENIDRMGRMCRPVK